DFADLYFQLSHQESWSLEDGMVKDGSASIEQGVGVRALAGEKTGFAYSDEIVLPALTEASRAARAIAVQGGERRVAAWHSRSGHRLYLPADPAADLATPDKVAWAAGGAPPPRIAPPRTKWPGSSVSPARRAAWTRASCTSRRAWWPCTRWCSTRRAT